LRLFIALQEGHLALKNAVPLITIGSLPKPAKPLNGYIFSKFLSLKRSGIPHEHLLHYYTAVIRPLLEYCSCVWHYNLTNELSLQIETIQKVAIRLIFECNSVMPHRSVLYYAGLSSLHSRRTNQARGFFQSIVHPDSCIHVLLPPPRDPNLLSRLRNPRMYPAASNRTKKYQSFV